MKGMIAEVMIIALTIVSTMLVLGTINPVIEEGKTTQSISDSKQVLKTMDSVLNQLAYEAPGAKRSIDVDVPAGTFIFSGKEDKLKVSIPNPSLKIANTVQEENIQIQGGGGLNTYEADILNDGNENFVMENSAVLLALKKLGSAEAPVFINTSSIITLIQNKRQNVNLTYPRSGIFIGEKQTSSYGYGYTQASFGDKTNSIIVHLNSTANITYDAIFTLAASDDFFEMNVRNIKKY
jgi:hypothetical protein